MNIGQAAKASGVSSKMIRYYEQAGLISAVDRTAAGYRDYSDDDIHLLRFVRGARDVGFQVSGIQRLLDLWTNQERKSADVKKIARSQIAELRLKIQGLEQMAETLENLVSKCAGNDRPVCPILEGLETCEHERSASDLNRSLRKQSHTGMRRKD